MKQKGMKYNPKGKCCGEDPCPAVRRWDRHKKKRAPQGARFFNERTAVRLLLNHKLLCDRLVALTGIDQVQAVAED